MGKVRPPYPREFKELIIALARAGRSPAEHGRRCSGANDQRPLDRMWLLMDALVLGFSPSTRTQVTLGVQ